MLTGPLLLPARSDTCVICQTAYAAGDDLTHLPCLHAFHSECITPWLQVRQPCCSRGLDTTDSSVFLSSHTRVLSVQWLLA